MAMGCGACMHTYLWMRFGIYDNLVRWVHRRIDEVFLDNPAPSRRCQAGNARDLWMDVVALISRSERG